MASPTQWTWIWADSGSWWRTGKPDVLQSLGVSKSRTQLSEWTATSWVEEAVQKPEPVGGGKFQLHGPGPLPGVAAWPLNSAFAFPARAAPSPACYVAAPFSAQSKEGRSQEMVLGTCEVQGGEGGQRVGGKLSLPWSRGCSQAGEPERPGSFAWAQASAFILQGVPACLCDHRAVGGQSMCLGYLKRERAEKSRPEARWLWRSLSLSAFLKDSFRKYLFI